MPKPIAQICWFFILACAFTWVGNLGNWLWPSDLWLTPMNPLGPIIAAPIAIWWAQGRAGVWAWLRRIVRFRAPVRVYAWAFCGPLVIILASFWLTVAAGARTAPMPAIDAGQWLLVLPIVLIAGPLPEELSFRGYGLETLQDSMSPLAASLWIGAGVMIWHLPLLMTGDLPLTVLLPLAGVAVVYGWLYQTGRSVWPLVLLHGQLNFVSGAFTSVMLPEPSAQAAYLAFLGLFYILWAAALVAIFGPSLGRGRHRRTQPLPV